MKKSLALPFRDWVFGGLIAFLLSIALVLIFTYAPTEATMGSVQRILYLHVSVAWCGFAGSLGMGACGAVYLSRHRLAWDHWAQSAGEVGWLCVTLTLITGSLWARQAWGVWWTWEPRLTSLLVLWMILAGIFLVRAGIDDPFRRARVGALLSILGVVDLPLVLLATRWFRGVHPVAPRMDPRMQFVLFIAVAGFAAFFIWLTLLRRAQLAIAERIAALEARLDSI
jgi:heme exporter protein C